ncbi:MAG: hypothetical protein PQJ46_06160, partial [Spirochaetales bacterium]|nr:hypothetical protein [Spirochaetales bacterium]
MNNSEIFDTLKLFIKLYPEAELRDIYKSFFQDEFGAGHIIDNPVEARSSFDRELEAMDSYGREKAVPCGLGHNFCRIPMDIIIDGKVSADEYFSAFSDDAESFLLPDIEVWKQKWRGIWDLISNFESSLNNFQKDSAEIFSA